jgi:23S rRNA (cytidine1920-2'-O)/16S rRNA (cytidine1409-2'-O)-methyltransferase
LKKIKLYELLCKNFAYEDKEAKSLIMAGKVFVDNKLIDKPGECVYDNSVITIKDNKKKYVTRSGYKLEKAISYFNIDVKNKIAVDIGASEGGFTDCLLQHGIGKVYSVDVAYGILAWKIRQDSRVIPLERTNARLLSFKNIGEYADIITVDVSFISLKLIFPVINDILHANGECICLIKPQFEAPANEVGKNGVITNTTVLLKIIHDLITHAEYNQLNINGLTYSPIRGNNGAIEYLLYLKRDKKYNDDEVKNIIQAVITESLA